MSRFDDCMQWIDHAEGGYSDDPADPGGPTQRGITQDTYDRYRRDHGLPPQPVKFIGTGAVEEIYLTYYFNPAKCPQLPIPVDIVMFDSWVQHRPNEAAEFLQRAVGATPDGLIGSATLASVIAAAQGGGPMSVALDIINQRRAFYNHRAEVDPRATVDLHGWMNRLDNLTKWIQQ